MIDNREVDTADTVGPYILHRQIARGGMASIHVARLVGDVGFSRIVAAKRMLPELAEDAEFVSMFIDEAKIASKVHHRNVVPVLDVVAAGGEVILVQEYVHGVPLNWLLKTARKMGERVPIDIAVSIASQILTGLHAAHETVGARGKPLNIVHRDVSPGNVMVAVDGTARLLDFGVAKAAMSAHITRAGTFKGKRTYSAPEALVGETTRQSDVYSLSVVLWELLVGQRMHKNGQPEDELIEKISVGDIPTVTEALIDERELIDDGRWLQLRALEPVVMRGLAVDKAERWPNAAEMERALVAVVRPASASEVAAWVKKLGKEFLDERDQVLALEEAGWRSRAGEMRTSREMAAVQINARSSSPRMVTTVPPPSATPAPTTTTDISRERRVKLMIAGLCGLVLLLAIVIVIVAAATSKPSAKAPEQPASLPPTTTPTTNLVTTPPAATPATPSPAVVQPPAPAPATLGTAGAQPPPPSPGAKQPEAKTVKPAITTAVKPTIETKAPPKLPPRVTKPAPKPVAKPQPKIVKQVQPPPPAPKKTTPPPPPPPPATTKAGVNCNPPYYFKGAKKIFKPQCL